MKIANASLQMASSHTATQSLKVSESLRMWVGNQRPDFEGRRSIAPRDPVRISDAGKNIQQTEQSKQSDDSNNSDPKLRLLISLIEAITGHKIRLFDASALQPDAASPTPDTPTAESPATPEQKAGYGVEYDYQASYSESETTNFAASGTIATADGKNIQFDLQFSLQRSYSEEVSTSLRLGDGQKKDPLVINFAGTAAQLTDTRFQFDLDADGTKENINFVQGGSGFLAIDRNHDGKVNNGSELFGPATGQGFAELSSLDSDGNGWIDENDAAYGDLRVWTKDAQGKDQLRSLKEANVGAIALSHVGTDFDLKNGANQSLGQIRSSGIYLQEDGRAGTIQQVDLTV